MRPSELDTDSVKWCISLSIGLNHPLICLAHQTVSFDASSILVSSFSGWTWCAVLYFAMNVIEIDLDSKKHTSISVHSSP